jgi:hypothetical protein
MFVDGLVARLFPTKKIRVRKSKKAAAVVAKTASGAEELDDVAKILAIVPNDKVRQLTYSSLVCWCSV